MPFGMQFFFRFFLDGTCNILQRLDHFVPMKRDVLQNDLIDKARDRVQVTREHVAPETQAFQRDGPAASKRVNQDRRF